MRINIFWVMKVTGAAIHCVPFDTVLAIQALHILCSGNAQRVLVVRKVVGNGEAVKLCSVLPYTYSGLCFAFIYDFLFRL